MSGMSEVFRKINFKSVGVDILPHLNDETVAAYAERNGLPQDQGC
jgi:hypothetical protein